MTVPEIVNCAQQTVQIKHAITSIITYLTLPYIRHLFDTIIKNLIISKVAGGRQAVSGIAEDRGLFAQQNKINFFQIINKYQMFLLLVYQMDKLHGRKNVKQFF